MGQADLQTAFEIKTMCDELSRRLLRWHWEQQEGRTLRQLADYVAERTRQAPDYFAHVQEIGAKATWQQLDTTFCQRILLDPGEGAEDRPLRLLSAAPRPVVARQSCNGLRMARNAAAHSTCLQDVAEAAVAFAEAIEKLDDGYGDAVFTSAELEKYRKAAARAVNLCREASLNQPEEPELPAAKRRSAQSEADAPKRAPAKSASAKVESSAPRKSGTSAAAAPTRKPAAHSKTPPARKKKLGSVERLFVFLAAAVFVVAVWMRAKSMGLLG